MSVAIGYASYIGFGQQTAFGVPQTTLVTAANMRSGTVFDPGQSMNARVTTTSTLQRASQLWKSVPLTKWSARFEYVSSASWKALLLAAMGRRLEAGAGPFTRTYILNNPPVDSSVADGTPASTFYHRGLTIRHTLHDGSAEVKTYVAQDCSVDQLQLFFETNKPVEFEVSGTGQVFAASTAPAYTDITGSLMTWAHAGKSANSGLYISSVNPPALNGVDWIPLRKATLTVGHNLLFEPLLGPSAGLEMQTPTRNGFPSVMLEIEGRFDGGTSQVDAVDIVADFIAQTAKNVRLTYYIDANNSLEVLCSGTVAPAIVDSPKPIQGSDGLVNFSARYLFFPDVITDFSIVAKTLL